MRDGACALRSMATGGAQIAARIQARDCVAGALVCSQFCTFGASDDKFACQRTAHQLHKRVLRAICPWRLILAQAWSRVPREAVGS